MRNWIMVAALGAALAPGGDAGAQGTPRRPAPARDARPATPAEADALRRGAADRARALEALTHLDAAAMHEAVALSRGTLIDMGPSLAAMGPALADMGPALAEMGPALADMGPALAGMGPAIAEGMAALDASRVQLGRLDLAGLTDVDGAVLFIDDDRIGASGRFSTTLFRGATTAGLSNVPANAWLPSDQADSTYREAREALNREQYLRASELFRQIHTRSPRSGYAPDALYWDAFALYRSGGETRLREALGLLEKQAKEHPRAGTRESAATLATRIRGQLAQGGDRNAASSIQTTAARSSAACENDDVRIAAINALSQMDAERALPIVRRVLLKRDDCSAPLREKAVYVVSQHHPADADQILLDVVKNDPSAKVKRQAVYYLGQTKSDRAVAALEELVRTGDDPAIQERALYSLAENGGTRTGEILRAVAERESASESLRSKAIYYLRERRGGDQSAYLRALYPKLTSTKLREQVMYSLGEIGGDENVRWLTAIAMDSTESTKVRSAALYRLSESRGSSTSELLSLYDRLRGREMREKALYYIAQRKEPAATAKLVDVLKNDADVPVRTKALYYLAQREDGAAVERVIEVAKSDPDREMRRKAVYYLGQSKDPRAIKALEDIIGQ